MKNIMRNLLLAIATIASLVPVAQSVDMDLFKNMNMRHVGPATMSGRVTSIDAVADDPRIIYVATASGGLWKSVSGGITWDPIFDDQPIQNIGSVAISQKIPSVVWAGTGEGNPRNSQSSGAGIFKSIDAGNSWKFMGLEGTKTIHRIIVHPDDPETVYVAATGSAWGPNPERGVYKTTDGGSNWENILFVNDSTGCADLVIDPSNPNKLMAAMWEYGRKPWTFNSGGDGSGLYITHDGGKTWDKRSADDGLPKGKLGRIGLAIAASNPEVAYALIESKETAIYKTTDGGFKWKKMASEDAGNRPFYYADIYVNPQDEKEIWSLWSMVSRSDDGGKTFKVVIPYSGVHPDHHAFWINPKDPNFMIDGNDGGLNLSYDGGENWNYVSNLPLGQFYHINYDMQTPYNIYGGMQDNGSWQGPAYMWRRGGIPNHVWKEVSFGDGFDVVPHPTQPELIYSMSQGGYLSETDMNTGQSRFIRPAHPDGEKLRWHWNAPIAKDPFSDCGLYYGSQYVHYTEDCGDSWTIISPDLSTNDSLKQKQAESGGLTIDVTDAENHTTLLCIAPSPHDKDVIWVGTDDGNVQLTRDGGKVWQNNIDRMKGAPKGAWVPQIEVSSSREGEAFVVINDYRRNNWEPYVYHTTSYGSKWTRIVDASDVTGYALSIVQDPEQPNLLFLGTEQGLYVSFDTGETWNKWEHDYPSVSTIDLKIHPREGDLIVGTFGRAAYVLDDISPLRLHASVGEVTDSIYIANIPDAYLAQYKRQDGIRFNGDMHWTGENRTSGARISYFVRNDIDKKAEKKGKDKKVTFHVLNEAGDTIRTFTHKPDSTGYGMARWDLRGTGVHWPSRRERKKDADEPGGLQVMSGKYQIVAEWGKSSDMVEVKVLDDPRLEYHEENQLEQREKKEEWMDMVRRASEGFERTKEALKTLDLVSKAHVNVEDSLKKDVKLFGDSVRKELKAIQNLYMMPKGTKGYHDESDLLSTFIWQSSSYLNSGTYRAPGPNAMNFFNVAKAKVDETVARINALFDGLWLEYRTKVDELDYSLFKEFEKIE
jgi:photosystem II stability/assembly factor-like uncharacterized protein